MNGENTVDMGDIAELANSLMYDLDGSYMISGALSKGLMLVLIVGGGLIALKIIMKATQKALKKSPTDELVEHFILKLIKVLGIVVIVVTGLSYMGVPMSTFVAILGTVGVAAALAWKDVLSNFAGGVLVLINRPFKKGDYIDDMTIKGTVEKVDLFFTTLTSDEGHTIIMPNSHLANTTIINQKEKPKKNIE